MGVGREWTCNIDPEAVVWVVLFLFLESTNKYFHSISILCQTCSIQQLSFAYTVSQNATIGF